MCQEKTQSNEDGYPRWEMQSESLSIGSVLPAAVCFFIVCIAFFPLFVSWEILAGIAKCA
jgi:hypothetical protein